MYDFVVETVVRACLAIIIGGVIGSERARHGRAAGMRTHMLVCLGSCMTALTSVFLSKEVGLTFDVMRLPAQVISGIGFLGAGMIILKSNNMITGLTTAAGVWTTATIGIAIGFGYYTGAIIVALFFLIAIILFAKFETKQKTAVVIYVEICNINNVNLVIDELRKIIPEKFSHSIFSPKSNCNGNVGLNIVIDKKIEVDIKPIIELPDVVFADIENA